MTLFEYLEMMLKLAEEFRNKAFEKHDMEMFAFYNGQATMLNSLINILKGGKVELWKSTNTQKLS